VVLFAVQSGLTDSVAPSGVGGLLQKGLDWLRQHNPQVRVRDGGGEGNAQRSRRGWEGVRTAQTYSWHEQQALHIVWCC
jgi:hypothetical protein